MTDQAKPPRRAPVAIELQAPSGKARRAPVVIEQGDFTADLTEPGAAVSVEASPGKRLAWVGSLFWGAAVLLLTLYLGDGLWDLVLRLEAKNPVLGRIGLGLIGIAVLTLLVWIAMEWFAVMRLAKVGALRERATRARQNNAGVSALDILADLRSFYARDAATAASRAALAELGNGLHDDATLLDEAERLLLQPKDDAARDAIAGAAQRVSLVTAVSPRALVDILFVLVQSVRLIRTLSAIYGGRASGLGLVRLSTRIAGHLAITGGMAAADSVMGEVMGSGLAARLSAKLGEGVLNGILTARIGIAAVEVCRPMPFVANSPIILSEVVKNSIIQKQVAEKPAG